MVYGVIVGHQNVSRNAYVSRLRETGHLQRCRDADVRLRAKQQQPDLYETCSEGCGI